MKNDVGMRWEMYDFSDLVNDITGGNRKFQSFEYQANAAFPIVDQSEKFISGFTNENAIVKRKKDVVIFGDHTKALKFIDFDFCLGADGVKVLEPVEELDSKFLFYFLNTITLPNVGYSRHFKFLKEISIPLPPLPIQKRIAEILDAADALKLKDQELLKKYDELAQAIFIDMFGDPVKNEKGWEVKKLGELSDVGSSVRVFVDELVDDGIPFLRGQEIGAMSNGEKIEPSLFITQEHYNKLNKQGGVPKIGDLLMPSICPDGRIFQVIDNEPFYFKDGRVLWIKTNEKYFNSEFLKFLLKEKFLRNYSNIASGSTFAELKIFALKALELPVPPINLQEQFSNLITSGIVQRNIARNTTKFGSCLFQALIQKAFKGELVAERAINKVPSNDRQSV